MIQGDILPRGHDVLHYVGATSVSPNRIDGSAFQLRDTDMSEVGPGVSFHWLNFFGDMSRNSQVDCSRMLSRLKLGKRAIFAELNVGNTLDRIMDRVSGARFESRPLPKEGEFLADPSHSKLLGLPAPGTLESELVGDMIAECVQRRYPAWLVTESTG